MKDSSNIYELLAIKRDDVVTMVREGLPVSSFYSVQSTLGVPAKLLASAMSIPDRTLTRRIQSGRLSPDESDRLFRLAKILELAVTVFDEDSDKAVEWLNTSKSRLGGQTPLSFVDTEPGCRMIEDMLYSIEFSMPA